MYRSLVNPQLADQSLVTLPIKGLDISRPIAMVYAKIVSSKRNRQLL